MDLITGTNLHNIIIESINSFILNESQASKSISAAKNLVMQKLGYNKEEADEFVRIKLRQDVPELRTPQGGKFILGVTRMFCDNQLVDARTIGNLNTTLKYVASDAHINEYDRDLNGMSAEELISRFAENVETDLENDKAKIDKLQFTTKSGYQIVRIDSFEQSSEYGGYTDWCVTHSENMFNSYTNDGANQFYFCLIEGFEDVPREPGGDAPLDEYGLSMIAVCVDENGALSTCTCRWNHDNGGDDHIMTTEQISNVIKMRFYEAFKPNDKWKEKLETAMQRLANGENPIDVFDKFYGFKEGFAIVGLGKKWNYINQNGEILYPKQWFDSCQNFSEGFAHVSLKTKSNYLTQNGNLLSKQWFDWCGDFDDGFAKVCINSKWNFINKNGELLFPDIWFNHLTNFKDNGGGFALVKLEDKYNFVNRNGEYLSEQWFDHCENFHSGFARICLGNKFNYLKPNGELIWQQPFEEWFDDCYKFEDGFAKVELDGQMNFIDQNGVPLSEQWFDDVEDFVDGFSIVKIDEQWNYLDKNGNFLSNHWFDGVENFYKKEYALVDLGGKYNLINRNGGFLSEQWFDQFNRTDYGLYIVEINGKRNYLNLETYKFIWNKPVDMWFDTCYGFWNGLAKVELNGKWNYIKRNGDFLSDQWFDYVDDSSYQDIIIVGLNGKHNLLFQNGKLLSDQWFDNKLYDFRGGLLVVQVDGKWNYLKRNGEFLSDQWFDACYGFWGDEAIVKLNNKFNYIDKNGEILFPNQWFDDAKSFDHGLAIVKLDGKYNVIKRNGDFLTDRWFESCFDFRDGVSLVYLNGKPYHLDLKGNILDLDGNLVEKNSKLSESYVRNAIRESIINFIWKDKTQRMGS